ncbi:MAG TPA: ankyrin repeat domain-containing protein [Alphaproteobacteria bacterium]|nr:hypothetical protein [Rhodospirillaceae bacterium]HRJ67523.1 ankyrin repeat domain-containing protein [Alphaproteobacteria bacterium]
MLDFGVDFNQAAANDNKPTQQMLDRQLLRAAEFDESEKIIDLIRRGADKNARHINNDTPLIIAAREGHEKTVRLLLRQNVDMHARNYQDEDAIAAARAGGNEAIAKRIAEKIEKQKQAAAQNQRDMLAPITEGSARDIPTLSLPQGIRRKKPPAPR